VKATYAIRAPWAPLRGRVREWFASRLPRTDSLRLTQRNIYILPTRAGLMFCATLFVLLLASINYQLNLGYVLTFLLAGSGVVSMHVTHNTLRGLTLHLRACPPVFAGEAAPLTVVLTSEGRARFGIGLKIDAAANATRTWVDVPEGGQASAQVSFVANTRGRHSVPTLNAETRFPLGLFRAWTVWRPAATVLVYPPPERPAAPLPMARSVAGGVASARRADGGETEGVRAWRRGDPMRLVYWKKAAKSLASGGELVSRDTSAASHHELWLEWQACTGLDDEARLARLTAWVLAAERAGADFGMRLPDVEIEPGQGDAHRGRCLEALALW
jgi:uncharacterized protein (DUF58 family)